MLAARLMHVWAHAVSNLVLACFKLGLLPPGWLWGCCCAHCMPVQCITACCVLLPWLFCFAADMLSKKAAQGGYQQAAERLMDMEGLPKKSA